MEDAYKIMEFNRLIREPVVEMADGAWARTQMIIAEGINSFTPAMRLCQDFSGEETFRVIVDIKTIVLKNGINNHMPYKWPSNFKQIVEFSKKIGRAPSKIASEPFEKLRVTDREAYFDLVGPYYFEMEKLRREEISRFTLGTFEKYNEDVPSRVKVYHEVMKQLAPKMGFQLDRDLSSPRLKIYSKELIEPYRLCLWIDKYELNRRYLSPVIGGKDKIQFRCSPRLILKFGVIDSQREGVVEVSPGGVFQFFINHFFLIQWPLLHRFHSYFNSLAELETMIIVHLRMYDLIRNEFEVRVKKGLENAITALNNGECERFRPYVDLDEWRHIMSWNKN